MIYILCENLNTIGKGNLCVIFNTIKYIVSNYVLILQIICAHNLKK